ncbi:MAG: hypothetical protein AB1Z67_02540 [Candidatus Limnocylindrales bacterium]
MREAAESATGGGSFVDAAASVPKEPADASELPGELLDPRRRSDLELALGVLIVLGRVGKTLHEALVERGETALVGNTEVLVVSSLLLRGSLRPADVMDLTGLSSGGVTKLLDRLEADDIIARELGAVRSDRRATRLVLTPRGERVARGFSDAVRDEIGAIRSAFAELVAAAELLAAARD